MFPLSVFVGFSFETNGAFLILLLGKCCNPKLLFLIVLLLTHRFSFYRHSILAPLFPSSFLGFVSHPSTLCIETLILPGRYSRFERVVLFSKIL